VPDSEELRKPVLPSCHILLDHISVLDWLLEQEFFLLSGSIQEAVEFTAFSLTP